MVHTRNLLPAPLIHQRAWQLCLATLLCLLAFSAAAALGLGVRDAPNGAGVEVTQVLPGSVAAQAGLKAGDIILQVEKNTITSAEKFAQRVKIFPDGMSFSIRISREGWERDLFLQPAMAAASQPKKFGLRLMDQTPGQPPGHGAQVVAVMPSSAAAHAGLKPGDVVTQVDGRKLARAGNLIVLMQETAAQDKPLRITVAREGWEKEVLLTPDGKPAPVAAADWASADQMSHVSAPLPVQAATEAAKPVQPAGPPQYPPARVEMTLDEAAYNAYVAELELADTNYRSANWQEAERHYQLVIQRGPNDPASWGRLGYALIMQQKFMEAVSACSQSLALGVPQPATLINLGYSHFKLGALSEAAAAYLRAVELAPQWAPPYSGLGAVYLTRQDWVQAEKYYRLAMERDPDNVADRQALEGAVRMQRDVSEVRQVPPDSSRTPPFASAGPAVAAGNFPRQSAQPLPQVGTVTGHAVGSGEAVPDGRKAIIAVGDFQVKAAGAGQFIGDGMREMLVTTLHNSGNYVVVERMDLPRLAAEQALSRSRMARPGAAIGESQMDVAEIMVYAAVTEFESEAKGGGVQLGIPNLPLNLGRQTKTAHMAIDMRVVDVATGRLIAAQRISGEAKSSQTSVGTILSVGGTSIPTSLGAFKNTPMEQAIRECIQKATAYITSNTPQQYFRHQ